MIYKGHRHGPLVKGLVVNLAILVLWFFYFRAPTECAVAVPFHQPLVVEKLDATLTTTNTSLAAASSTAESVVKQTIKGEDTNNQKDESGLARRPAYAARPHEPAAHNAEYGVVPMSASQGGATAQSLGIFRPPPAKPPQWLQNHQGGGDMTVGEKVPTGAGNEPMPILPIVLNATEKEKLAETVIAAIFKLQNVTLPHLACPAQGGQRYSHLKTKGPDNKLKYFFALDLHECAHLLPSLMGAIVQSIRFLGPKQCTLSIVEGRSTDGTYEILSHMRNELEHLGTTFYLSRNNINPKDGDVDRIIALSELRNQALGPLYRNPQLYSNDTTIVFINDVSLCMDDILELLHQHTKRSATMTCGIDWIGTEGETFYDVWVSRGINGDLFFEVPPDMDWKYSRNLFWNDMKSYSSMKHHRAFQVYSCWNGIVTLSAKPMLDKGIRFRGADVEKECYAGEPTLLAKDFWRMGAGRIQVVPSVNVGYSDKESELAKKRHGHVSKYVDKDDEGVRWFEWKKDPPGQVRCVDLGWRSSWGPPL
jgi:alpha-1,3-mannosyltransferase